MTRPLLAVLFAVHALVVTSALAGEPGTLSGKTETAVVPVGTPAAKIAFDDPAHKHFFRYQKHLKAIGLPADTKESWAKLTAPEQKAKLAQGEAFLKAKYSVLLRMAAHSAEDTALLKAVWGDELAAGVAEVQKAARVGDPALVKAAVDRLTALQKKFGGPGADLNAAFDGSKAGVATEEALPSVLAPTKADGGFVASLASPEVTAPLANRQVFLAYLEKKGVPPESMPALDAMYGVLTRAKGEEKAQTAHILPTLVRFLNDGKKIVMGEEMEGALGYAVPGEYDRPEMVGITPAIKTADPTVTASVLAHEFQHIHDMYAGRYYTLDSELRGFKTNVMFMNIMRSDPQMSKRLDQLINSDNDSTRAFFRDHDDLCKAHAHSAADFANSVAFGHHYNNYYQGVFSGRLPLREAVDPRTGLARQVAAQRYLRDKARAEVAVLEKKQAEIRAQRDKTPSRELDKELEKVTKDLASARGRDSNNDKELTLGEIRLRRMESEVAWMDKKAAAKGVEPSTYDLSLPVDAEYVTP